MLVGDCVVGGGYVGVGLDALLQIVYWSERCTTSVFVSKGQISARRQALAAVRLLHFEPVGIHMPQHLRDPAGKFRIGPIVFQFYIQPDLVTPARLCCQCRS